MTVTTTTTERTYWTWNGTPIDKLPRETILEALQASLEALAGTIPLPQAAGFQEAVNREYDNAGIINQLPYHQRRMVLGGKIAFGR